MGVCYGLYGAQKEAYCIKVCMRQNREELVIEEMREMKDREAARMTQISGFRG